MTAPKVILLLISLTICHYSMASESSEERVRHIQINSAIAAQQLKFSVILPPGYDPNDKQRYPVFYTQADSIRMKLIQRQIDWLSHLDFGPVPQMLIITLPYIELPNQTQHKDAAASGLATPLTIKVLEQELLPYIDAQFKTQPFRIVEGYSTQGNLPLGVLALKPDLFNAYISISPALVLDKSGLLKQLNSSLSKHNLAHRTLFASLGNFEQNRPLFTQLEEMLTSSTSGITSQLLDLSQVNYYTTPVTALPQALEQLFKDRHPKDIEQFRKQGMSAVSHYFKQLKAKYGYSMSPLTTLLDLGQLQLEHNENKAALKTLEHVVKLKPNSIYYLTLLAQAQRNNQQITAAKHTLDSALALAKATKIQGEINYVQSQIDSLN